MKKIIVVLFLLVNALLFFNIREVYMEKDVVDVSQLHYFHPDIVHTALIISNPNNASISDEISEAMFEMFKNLTEHHDIMIMYGEFNFERNEYFHYLTTGIPIDERLDLVTNESLHFNEQDTYFYTNRHGVQNGINFFLLNQRIDVRISPLTALGTIRGGEYIFVALSQAELDEVIAAFMAEFEAYVANVIEFSWGVFDVEEAINSFLPPIILMAMVSIFLIIIMYVHIYSKKIAILKTTGLSFFHQAKQLFFPLVVIIFLTIVGSYTLLFFLFVGSINRRTLPIIETLVYAGGLQLIGVVITIGIGCLLLLFIPTYSVLKNSNLNRFLMGANYIMKMVVLVMMLPFISGRVVHIQNNLQMINHVRHYEQNGALVEKQFSPMLHPRYRGDGFIDLVMELRRMVEFEVLDRSLIYEHDLLYEYYRAYQLLNEAGGVFVQSASMASGEPALVVNENYLTRHAIKDRDGNVVDVNQLTADVIHLVPESYLERSFMGYLHHDGHEIITIHDEQMLFDYSLSWRWGHEGIPTQPYVISVYRDVFFQLGTPDFFNRVFVNGDINELLSETSFYNRILISTLGDELSQIRERHVQEMVDHILVMVPTFVLVLVIISQYAYLYLKVYQKRIYAKKLMGHNPFHIFAPLLLESSLAVLAAISIAWYVNLDFRLLLVIILFEMFVYLVVIAISKWKHSLVFDYGE